MNVLDVHFIPFDSSDEVHEAELRVIGQWETVGTSREVIP